MRHFLVIAITIAIVLGSALCGASYNWLVRDTPDLTNYKRIAVGMSVEEVESVLGPGTQLKQEEVPKIVVAVNPSDEADSAERARRTGSVPTARDYATRLKPLVEGDHILQWVNSETGARILVAFRNGRVCEKHLHDPNYF